jgi:hypothetical protein
MKINFFTKTLLLALITFNFSWLASAQGPVSSGLMAHYCFDGNANDAVGTKNCTVYGAALTSDRNGNPNSAYSFDGIDDYIQAPNDVWFNGDFTITAWLYVSSYKNFAKFFDFSNGAPGDNLMYSPTPTSFSGDAFINRRNSCSATPFEGSAYSSPFPIGDWVFITLVLKGNYGEVWRNAINSTIYSSPILGPVCNFMRTMNYFGKSPWSHDAFFHGKMDDIRIYNRALNALEIDTLYKINKTCQQQSNIIANSSTPDFYLSQNTPNPFINQSLIQYKLPFGSKMSQIQIVDITGKIVSIIELEKGNAGSISLSNAAFRSGFYYYSLVVDGKIVDRKKMMVLNE